MAKALMLVLAGIAIGILIAPEKGTATVKKITDYLDDAKDDAEDFANEASSKMKSKIQLAKADAKNIADDKL